MKILLLALMISLAGCASKNAIQFETKLVVVDVPDALFNCPQIGKVPDPETLTNQEVADFIKLLYKYNKICGISLAKIKQFIDETKIILEE